VLLWFVSRYPVTLSRNVLVHSVVYFTYFLCTSFTFLVRSMIGYHVREPVNTALAGITAACVVAWGTLLTASGERRAAAFRPALLPEQEFHLIRQLDSLNATLLRVARK
jgi:hypothetical protein